MKATIGSTQINGLWLCSNKVIKIASRPDSAHNGSLTINGQYIDQLFINVIKILIVLNIQSEKFYASIFLSGGKICMTKAFFSNKKKVLY